MRLLSRRVLGLELPLIALWVGFAVGLSEITTRVTDWFDLPDELVYERLAISIAKSGSPLPRIHGELVRSLDQLYPLLIAPFFRHGFVPQDLRQAHLLNAWLMTSACIPAFLLARRVTGRRWAAYVLAILTVCMPWLVYSPFLLTEVVAYPVVLWALVAMHSTIVSPSRRNDLLALLGIAFAFLARTQFVVLAAVLPLALVAYELVRSPAAPARTRPWRALRGAAGGHRVAAWAYVLGATAAVVFVASGHRLFDLSIYGNELHGSLLTSGSISSFAGHAADLSFGLGVLPFVVGTAWLLANLVRASETKELQAFACLGSVAVFVITLEATTFDQRLGNFVLDRYLFYLVPVVVLAFVCALLDPHRPRFSALIPAAVVAVGFATHLQPTFTWSAGIQLDPDTPIATLYEPIARLAHGRSGAAAALVFATLLLTALFVLGAELLRPRLLTLALVVALVVGLPAETAYTFNRLLGTDGASSRPLTQPMTGYDWLDRMVGTHAEVTAIPYVVSSDYFVTLRYWRDFEFWNKSVAHDAYEPTGDLYSFLGMWPPKTILAFDPATGAVNVSPSGLVIQSVTESRFRISGVSRFQTPEVMLIKAVEPWRLDWLSFGLYDDGWTRPGVTARIRIFPAPGQHESVLRTLTLQIRGPYGAGAQNRPYQVVSSTGRQTGKASANFSSFARVEVCVPAQGFGEVRVSTPDHSTIPGDLSSGAASVAPRQGGIDLADIALADEIGGGCRLPHRH